ncbi:hypothetical protein MNBD_PLANCTO02-2846, partial [hydrothermal vent metagenome]
MITKTPEVFTFFAGISDPRQQVKVNHSLIE